ncbi:MAG: putative manganese-dependent inorganic diphosphatase [Oscillospiraceae bacterium]|nr:putative manganese-dependent inorganic diphosphatase [Oscillospiraceae bacterium]
MSEIFVTGHRNPDTDSIAAAMAYAHLQNALGNREYVAARIGGVNDETQHMLDYFGFESPVFIKNMRTQVKDLFFDRPPELNRSVPMELAWRSLKEGEIAALPILNDDGTLYGMLTAGDIASYNMGTIANGRIEQLPIFNLLSVLEGQLVNAHSNLVDSVSGDVVIALPQAYEDCSMAKTDSIIICGDQSEVIEAAIKNKVSCLIICRAGITPERAENCSDTCIIATSMDARTAARLVYQATPIMRVCQSQDIVSFHLNDYLDDVKEILAKSRFRCYPILDENEKVVGTLSRFHLMKPRRKRVVLVDHNESAQSVPGLEQVEILEIIDHHRLADIQTGQPIMVRNEPVGSTNTIITDMYQEHGVMPPPRMAGLMAAAILSDTVMFKSPTCTKKDISTAERLARIAGISIDALGKELFSVNAMDDKDAEELFKADYKVFHISDHDIGVSQITCVDSQHLLERRDEFVAIMEDLKKKKAFDLMLLMVTDVLLEGSHILYVGSDDIIHQAFNVVPKDKYAFLKGVMSRKKQIIPMLTALWG